MKQTAGDRARLIPILEAPAAPLVRMPALQDCAGRGQEEMTGDRKAGLAAVVPAAGLSRRMGSEKVLLPFGRSTVLETILETLAAAGVAQVAVVLRPDLTEAAEKARRVGVS